MKKIIAILSGWIFASKRPHFLWGVSAIALLIRLAVILFAGNPQHPDVYEHGWIAHNLYAGQGFAINWPYPAVDPARIALMKQPPQFENSYQPPLNPYLMYGAYTIFGENSSAYIFLMLIYAIVSSFIPLAVFKTGLLIGSEKTARMSATISALFLPGAFAVVTFSGSSIHQLLGIIILYYAILATQKPSLRTYILLGICCGIMTLLRSEFFILSFFIILVSLFFASKKVSKKRILLLGGVSVILCLSLIAPWTYRNYLLYHRFVPIVDRPWHEIWRGNNIYSTVTGVDESGTIIAIEPSRFPQLIAKMDSLPFDQQFSMGVDSIFRHEAITFIEQYPGRTAWLDIKKIFALLTVVYYPGRPINPIYVLCMLIVAFSSIIGMLICLQNARARRDYGIFTLFMTFFLYYCFIVMLTFIIPRYQIYIFSVLLPLTGLGCQKIVAQFRSKKDFRSFGRANLKKAEVSNTLERSSQECQINVQISSI